MTNKIKNVIFLTVDSMRYDRMQCNGYPMHTTPSIESLMKNGISCSNAFTHSHPTQFSFPSIFTSTLPLDFGGYIIDTPGIKGFGLIDFVPEEVPGYFPEFGIYSSNCKFNNCTHTHEPSCAVVEAVNNGAIAKSRYNNYLAIIKDDYFSEKPY